MQKSIKPILIIIGLVGMATLVYIFVIRPNSAPENKGVVRTTNTGVEIPLAPAQQSKSTISAKEDVGKFKKLLAQLETVNLNKELFSNQRYMQLNDNTSVALEELRIKAQAPLGKDNPFLGFEQSQIIPTPTNTAPGRVTPRR